jgi:hypothetical protein
MEVRMGELTSSVEARDAELVERIVERVVERVREELAREQRLAEERRLWPSVFSDGGRS